MLEHVRSELERDVASFADPGTRVLGGVGRIEWVRDRTPREAQLIASSSVFPDVIYEGRKYSYAGFLASEAMADIRHLAESLLRVVPDVPNYLPGPGRLGDALSPDPRVGRAPDLIISASIDEVPYGATRVLFLQGNAGAGKSSLLRHITRVQAERYVRGETTILFLYLDAQGKGLAQLEDVMARALQDLRARFTYHSVAALTRRRCLIPIVDGFDELIGPSSAREAFTNLAQFLAQLDREGCLLASSRSAFIDYRTLHERATEIASKQGLSYDIQPITVLPWEDSDVFKYVRDLAPGEEALPKAIGELLGSVAGPLIRKPFFLSHVADIIRAGKNVLTSRDIVEQVVEAALDRETGKLSNKQKEPLLTTSQHREFCIALAEEMWLQQSAELDCDTVRLIAEIAGDHLGLRGADAKLFVDRSIAHGLLTTVAGSEGKREFEHELFRFEFQAQRVADSLDSEGNAIRDLLVRGDLPLDIVLRVPIVRHFGAREISQIAKRLGDIAGTTRPGGSLASNAGALVFSLLSSREDLDEGMRLAHFYVREVGLGRCRLKGGIVSDCILEHVDLTRCTLTDCKIERTTLIACSVGPDTRLEDLQVDPGSFAGLVVTSSGGVVREIYDPAAIRTVLHRAGARLGEGDSTLDAEAEDRSRLVEELLNHARSHYYLSPSDVWVQRHLVAKGSWPQIKNLMVRYGLLEEVKVNKSGQAETFMRLTVPPDIILGSRSAVGRDMPSKVSDFWSELSQ